MVKWVNRDNTYNNGKNDNEEYIRYLGVILVMMINIDSDFDQLKTDYTFTYQFDHFNLYPFDHF